MKKGILFILGMLMMVSTTEAANGNPNTRDNSKSGYYAYYSAKPITFVERGIKFYVYPNGRLNFNANIRAGHTRQYVYRNGRRYVKKVPYSKVRITRDYYGRIKSVGNVYINYNRLGKVSRIGSVFVDYNRRRMVKVGGLYIKYNRFGDVRYFGHVKPRYSRSRIYNYNHFYDGMILNYDDDFFYESDFYEDFEDYDQDDDYYYYKSKKGKGLKQGEILKRKKAPKDILLERKKRK